MLVYDRPPGELVGTLETRRADPASVYQRFARLPADRLLGIFDALIDLHQNLADLGWVASDLYDGCLMVELGTRQLTVIDLDSYRRGPSLNTMGRMFGSTRFMAPEEFCLGAPIDQRTTVFNLARLVWHFATRLTERTDQFCGSAALRAAVEQATAPSAMSDTRPSQPSPPRGGPQGQDSTHRSGDRSACRHPPCAGEPSPTSGTLDCGC